MDLRENSTKFQEHWLSLDTHVEKERDERESMKSMQSMHTNCHGRAVWDAKMHRERPTRTVIACTLSTMFDWLPDMRRLSRWVFVGSAYTDFIHIRLSIANCKSRFVRIYFWGKYFKIVSCYTVGPFLYKSCTGFSKW